MSAICINGVSECTGCGACRERGLFASCDECYEDIYSGDEYYDVNGDIITQILSI